MQSKALLKREMSVDSDDDGLALAHRSPITTTPNVRTPAGRAAHNLIRVRGSESTMWPV